MRHCSHPGLLPRNSCSQRMFLFVFLDKSLGCFPSCGKRMSLLPASWIPASLCTCSRTWGEKESIQGVTGKTPYGVFFEGTHVFLDLKRNQKENHHLSGSHVTWRDNSGPLQFWLQTGAHFGKALGVARMLRRLGRMCEKLTRAMAKLPGIHSNLTATIHPARFLACFLCVALSTQLYYGSSYLTFN